jgi:hypothetical protein
VAAQFKAWIVSARSNTGLVGYNPTRGKAICQMLHCIIIIIIIIIKCMQKRDGHTNAWAY